MEFQTLTVEIVGHVATVTLNRPDVRNAFNEFSIAELSLVFTDLGRMDSVRAIVLAASGVAFCAGADLNWMKKMAGYSHSENAEDAEKLADMLRIIYLCPKPVVAKVQGDCYAGGMGPGGSMRHRGGGQRRQLLPVGSEAWFDPGHDFPVCDQGDGRKRRAPLLPNCRKIHGAGSASHRLRARHSGRRHARRPRRGHRQGARHQQP